MYWMRLVDRLLGLGREFHHHAFRPATYRACKVQIGCLRGAPGENKRGQRRQFGIEGIDVAFKPLDLARQHPQALRLAVALGHGEVGAEIEQIVLDAPQHRIQFGRIGQMHPHNADRGVVSSTEP